MKKLCPLCGSELQFYPIHVVCRGRTCPYAVHPAVHSKLVDVMKKNEALRVECGRLAKIEDRLREIQEALVPLQRRVYTVKDVNDQETYGPYRYAVYCGNDLISLTNDRAAGESFCRELNSRE